MVNKRNVGSLPFGLALLLLLFAPAGLASLDSPPVSVTIPAGDLAAVTIRGFCLDYGRPFPGPELDPGSLAADELRLAVSYSLAQSYADTDPWQVQLAVWYLVDGRWHDADHDLAAEIVTYARSGATPPDVGLGGTSLPQAIAGGLVTTAIDDYHSISSPAYYGEGTLVLSNVSGAEQQIYFPYGTIFAAIEPPQAQRMLVYAVEPTVPPTASPEPPTTITPAPPPTTDTVTPEPPPDTVTPEPGTPTPTSTVFLPPSGEARSIPGGGLTVVAMSVGLLMVAAGWLLHRRQS